MLADLMKDITSDLIARAKEEFDLNDANAAIFVDDYPNESDWPQVANAADALNLDIMDISPDDVERINAGGEPKGEISTSLGKVFYWYNILLGTFILTTIFDKGNPANYPISGSDLKEIKSAESFGTYFNSNIRANAIYSDKDGACGCIGDDPSNPKKLCTSEDFANMPKSIQAYVQRFVAIS